MESFSESAWNASRARQQRGPRQAAARRRGGMLVWAAVIVAAASSIWPASVAVAQRPEVTENSLGMRLVKIPAGEFKMGSEDFANEKPVRLVRITRAFLLGETEVTQGQWRKVMDTLPWSGQDNVKNGDDVAATYVSWDDAVQFCERLTKLEQPLGKLRGNRRYRLPTEAEWEYACRAGTKTQFSFGNDEERLAEFASYIRNTWDTDEKYAHEVGQRNPNPWGLHDMHGNVLEWCSDWYDEGSYAKSPPADPAGPDAGSFRVVRGGSYRSAAALCRSAFRYHGTPANRYGSLGFRVVCELE